MQYFLPILIVTLSLTLTNCTIPTIKERSPTRAIPLYHGVDKQFVPYEAEYRALAAKRGIKFTKTVNIGFSHIKVEKIVGFCNYNINFREIDIDIDWWNENSPLARRALIFHELGHCRCTRSHDWGAGEKYPEADSAIADTTHGLSIAGSTDPRNQTAGHWPDLCPMSIMYPHVINDKCMAAHGEEYEKEMFNRCVPY